MTTPEVPQLMLNRGRDFLLSPAWGDAEPSALFDRNSGDYWIITELARHLIVELSESSVACSRDALFRHAQTAFPDEVEADMIEAVVDELLRLDILQHQSA